MCVLLERARENTRMKLSFCTNGSMRVLKTWATSGPSASGFNVDFFAVLRCLCASRSAGREAAHRQRVEQFVTPTSVLGRAAKDRNQRCLRRRRGRSAARVPRRSAAFPRSSAPSPASSTSMIDSISGSRISLRIQQRSGRIVPGTCSVLTTPLKSWPCPIGTFSSTQALPHNSLMDAISAGKFDVLAVHLVDDDDPAQPRLAGLVEHTSRVDFDAGLGVDHDRRRVDAMQVRRSSGR